MGGGLMQLVAYGAQDIYLTGNPQITFFKVVYRRHTNFSMETIEQTINGVVGTGGNSTVTVSRNGDLVYKIYVTGASPTPATTNGSGIVSEVELEIGGQKIDKHYEEWNQIWNELSTDESKAIGLKSMIGDIGTSGVAATTGVKMTQYPLNFWFCRNPGLALPLIALQYHEVKLKFKWGDAAAKGVDSSIKVMCDYIYLDTDERRRFAQVSHEYLIEQIQQQSFSGASNKLNFNHPVKELIWTSQPNSGYTNALLKLNGHDRFSAQNAEYFQLRQPYDYHTAVPAQNLPTSVANFNGREMISNVTAAGVGLLNDVGEGLHGGTAVTNLEWNDVVSATGGGVAPINGQINAGDTAPTVFIAVNGVAAGGLTTGSLSIGDMHHLDFRAANAAQTSHTSIGVVTAIHKRTGDAATGAGIGPIAGGQTVTDSGTSIPANQIIIEYDQTVTSPITSGDNDQLFIRRIGESGSARTSKMTNKINVYSFGLKPEEHQPSGTCNFSRIDNAKLDFGGTGTVPTAAETIYAVNYNVLRIMSGMGGLAYSN